MRSNYQVDMILPLTEVDRMLCNSKSSLHSDYIEAGIWSPTGCVHFFLV